MKTLDHTQKAVAIAVGILTGIGAVVGGVTYLHSYIADHTSAMFVPQAQAQALSTEVTKAALAAKDAADAAARVSRELSTYIKRQDLNATREALQIKENQLSETQLWESTNGANDISRARKYDLVREIERLKDLVQCYEAQRPDCG